MKNKTIQTQVIGGKYKGVKLDLPSLSTTRSTKSILKESVFNTLNFDIVDTNFIEVFGGSGSMAIEAVSRGAKHSFAIELDPLACKVLQTNTQKIDKKLFTCIKGDSFGELGFMVDRLESPAFIYFDPPFEYREDMERIYEKCFKLLRSLDEKKIILAIFEHMSTLQTPQIIGNFQKTKTKKFGKSSISYYSL